MDTKKSFKFYTSWNQAIKKMNETQVRNFLNNLCNYCEGVEPQLNDLTEEIMWSQVQPLLDYNESMRQKKINNGKKGGVAKASKSSKSYQNVANVANPSVDDDDDVEDEVEDEVEDDRRKKKVEDIRINSVTKQLWNEIISKINKSGWNSLSVKECSTYYDLKQIYE